MKIVEVYSADMPPQPLYVRDTNSPSNGKRPKILLESLRTWIFRGTSGIRWLLGASSRTLLEIRSSSPVMPKSSLHLWVYKAVSALHFSLTQLKTFLLPSLLKSQLKKYEANSNLPESSPFGVFFLHAEPEMTVNPLGDVTNQVEAIEALSRALPEGWVLLVKEHPNQFKKHSAGYFTGRHEAFYEDILSCSNISFVRKLHPGLGNPRFVSTVSGTAGFEWAMKGTPSIIFGSSWYESLSNVFHPKSQTELNQLLCSIKAEELKCEDATSSLLRLSQLCCKIQFNERDAISIGADWNEEANRLSLSNLFEGFSKKNSAE